MVPKSNCHHHRPVIHLRMLQNRGEHPRRAPTQLHHLPRACGKRRAVSSRPRSLPVQRFPVWPPSPINSLLPNWQRLPQRAFLRVTFKLQASLPLHRRCVRSNHASAIRQVQLHETRQARPRRRNSIRGVSSAFLQASTRACRTTLPVHARSNPRLLGAKRLGAVQLSRHSSS
jgi:hypothetical protein